MGRFSILTLATESKMLTLERKHEINHKPVEHGPDLYAFRRYFESHAHRIRRIGEARLKHQIEYKESQLLDNSSRIKEMSEKIESNKLKWKERRLHLKELKALKKERQELEIELRKLKGEEKKTSHIRRLFKKH